MVRRRGVLVRAKRAARWARVRDSILVVCSGVPGVDGVVVDG